MQRYELVAGTSAKFWEAGVKGSMLTVRFGRIGTQGQSQNRNFATADAAEREFDKLVKEKTGKGYRAVAAGPAAAAAIPQVPAVLQAPTALPAAAEPRPPTAVPPAPARQDSASIFAGTPLPSRMRPGPPLDPAADWAGFVATARPLLRDAPARVRDLADDLAARLAREPARPLTGEQALDWIEYLLVTCPSVAQRPWGKKPGPQGAGARIAFTHFCRWLVARSGTRALVDAFETLRPQPTGAYDTMPESLWEVPTVLCVRASLTAVPDADYEAALAVCLRRHAEVRDHYFSAFLAYVLADDRPHARHALRVAEQLPTHAGANPGYGNRRRAVPLIADLPPSQAAPWQTDLYHRMDLAFCDVTAAEVAATVIDVARAAGEPATASLAWLLRDAVGTDRTVIAKALLETRAADALDALLPFVGSKLVRDALDAADEAFPAWTLRACLAALDGKGEAALKPRVAALVVRHGAEAARAWAAGNQTLVGRLDRLLAEHAVPLAPRETWPAVLADPPWRRRGKARERGEVAVEPIPTPFAHGFGPFDPADTDHYAYRNGSVLSDIGDLTSAIEAAEAENSYGYRPQPPPGRPLPACGSPDDTVLAWLQQRLAEMIRPSYWDYGGLLRGVAWQPERLALLLWSQTRHLVDLHVSWSVILPRMVARFGERAVPGLVELVAADPIAFMPRVEAVDADAIAPVAARTLLKVKRARAAALVWLRAHPRTAAMRLLPASLGPAGPERDAADAGLRALAATPEGRAAFDAAVAAYAAVDPRVTDAVANGVDGDPLDQVPAKVAKLPAWLVPTALSRPCLASGGALPDEAVGTLCEMLAFSSPLAPYAGIALVRDACTAESLDGFALDLFRAWVAAGANTASEWAMGAMGLLGGDRCARDLTRQIRVWGQAGLKPRGKAGIAVLAAVGTDAALVNLSALAEKNPVLQLREAAKEALAIVGEARGLDQVDLADRLSPDLGLDARGGLDLDFGPRSFRVGFDEVLHPWVRDAEGRRLPALPRPAKTDDPEKAKAAGKLWAGLKKDAEATARLQITRLETMLATGRRVAPDVFWPFFAAHPLVRHVASRLVWGLYDDALPTTHPRSSFRLAEDLSATDADDAPLDVDVARATGVVGLVHPLHLGAETLARWGALFGDYEIAQPFAQLGRETFALTAAEAASAAIDRFAGARVAGRRLRGLRAQGWATDAQAEVVSSVGRRVALPDGSSLVAVLGFAEGFYHGPSREDDGVQTLETLVLTDAGWGASNTRRFGDLDPVTASEVLRTPSLLAAAGED